MKVIRVGAQHWAAVPTLFLLYLLLATIKPSQWHMFLLGVAVVLAAKKWEVRGGLLAASGALIALIYGLWRIGGTVWLGDFGAIGGYVWAWGATLSLGAYVGNLTRQTRAMVRINADLQKAQQRLGALHKIALTLSTTLDANRLMDMILDQLGQLWGYTFGSILLLDESTGELVVTAARGYKNGAGHRISMGAGIAWAVIQSGQPICVGDVTKEPRYVQGLDGARSELTVPLIWEGKALGVLNVESRELGAFGPPDVDLLTTVAEQAAAYLGNARLHQRAQHMAITDPHTGLYNYRHFQDQLGQMIRDAQLGGNDFSLIMLDLDYFKRCNDTYGHPTGDAILVQAAKVLKESCRQQDLVFRYGGEEFAIILPGADEEAAALVAERVRERIAEHPFTTRTGRRLDFPLTASIGGASYPIHGLSHVDLLIVADTALYTAKASGRNRVVYGLAHNHAIPAS